MISNSPRRIRKASFFLKQESPLMIQVRSKDFLLLNNWRLWFAFPSGQSKGGAGVGVWVEPLKFTGKGAAWKIPCFLTPAPDNSRASQDSALPSAERPSVGITRCTPGKLVGKAGSHPTFHCFSHLPVTPTPTGSPASLSGVSSIPEPFQKG